MDVTVKEAGKRGGLARAAALSPERRREIARNAVIARWEKAKRRKVVGRKKTA